MKTKLILSLITYSLLLALPLMAQDENGFTNRYEAKNQTVNDQKEGKWVEYMDGYGDYTNDVTADYYILSVYKNGKEWGMVRDYYKSGVLHTICNYVNGNPNGTLKEYDTDGKLLDETPFVNGQINGTAKTYYKNGKISGTILYKDGIEQDSKLYNEDGSEEKLSTINDDYNSEADFTDKNKALNIEHRGIRKGRWCVYLDKGFAVTEDRNAPYYRLEVYHEGTIIGTTRTYYKSGKLYEEVHYENGVMNGESKSYYESGKLMSTCEFAKGLFSGYSRCYYESGKLKNETLYTNGYPGTTKEYNQDGTVKK